MSCCTDLSLLEPVFEQYGKDKGELVTILQKAQGIYGYLPGEVLTRIAERTGVKPSKVMGVATFYAQFRTKPVGKHLILLCRGTACHVNGAAAIEAAVSEYLNVQEGGITEDGLFTYNNVACLGCCSLSPAMMIDDEAYGTLTEEKVVRILRDIRDKELGE